jgi:hypothetical protein
MAEVVLSRTARVVLDAALRLKAGTLLPEQRQPAFWDGKQMPDKLILGDVGPRPGWPDLGGSSFFIRNVEVWGMVGGQPKQLARFEMTVSQDQGKIEPPDDNAAWKINSVTYLSLAPKGDGTWYEKEYLIHPAQAIF